MIGLLAMFCAAGSVGMLFAPSPAARRLARLSPASRPAPAAVAWERLGVWAGALRARRQSRALWRSAVIELCDGIGAELTAGRTPEAALGNTLAVLDPRVATILLTELTNDRLAGNPPQSFGEVDVALERLAVHPGAEGLRLLSACWRIGAERGGTFATVIEGLAVALRDEEAQRQEVASQLAGPRATARLLAGLPLLGLAMAAALGANPLAFLFGTLPGATCLSLGVGLDILGLLWTGRLARAAEVSR